MEILGIKYQINLVNDNQLNAMGICDHNRSVINISNILSQDRREAILLHEIIHAICEQLNIDLEEIEVDNLSVALYEIHKANNYKFDYFKKNGKKGYDKD